jgi:protein involved in polysaccharide export with SLBB domain
MSITTVSAQTLSPAMLEQFKSMPRAEQEALARQYGVDLNTIGQTSTSSMQSVGEPGTPLKSAQQSVAQTSTDGGGDEVLVEVTEADQARFIEPVTPASEPLTRFGLGLFDQTVSTFAPTDNALVPPDYRLGVGDELVIQLFGKDNSVLNLQVGRDGIINFPKLGPISVAGLTFEAAQRLLQTRVSEQLIGVESMVSMGRLRAMNIFMAGEVSVPGAYSVSALTTITQALFQAGGITEIGSLRDIQVKRSGRLIASFDVYDLLLKGDISGDVRLQSGDVVFVPPYESLVTLTGEVKRPGIYEVANGETLGQMVNMAGGYKSSAFAGELVLIKKRNPGELPVAINIKAGDPGQLKTQMSNGDIVRVLPLGDNVENLVTMQGALARPGVYGWTAGLRVSDLIGDVRRDLLPDADLTYSLIVRQRNEKLDIEVIQFSLVDALAKKGGAGDPVLQPRDKIIVFSWEGVTPINESLAGADLKPRVNARRNLLIPVIEKLRSQASANQPADVISISGPVRSPGSYPFASGHRVSDLVKATGGLLEEADREYGLVVRVTNEEQDIEVMQFKPSAALSKAGGSDDPVLTRKDRVVLFSFGDRSALETIVSKLTSQATSGEPTSVVSIAGAVKIPGQYPIGRGYSLNDLIDAAGGTDDSAYTRAYEVRRMVTNAQGENDVVLENVTAEQARVFELQSRDFVTVKQTIDWNPDAEVVVTGEVKFPGTYVLRRGETLADVVTRAGGLTPQASVDAAIFTRESIAELESAQARQFGEQLRREFAASLMTQETQTGDYTAINSIVSDLQAFSGYGRLVIDLESALEGDAAANLLLEDGDVLRIPKQTNTVTVIGEVRRQGSHTFESDLALADYLGLAAGATPRADEDNIYIVKASGKVVRKEVSWTQFTNADLRLQPGDTVVVPIDTTYKDSVPFWRDITQILYQGTVAIAAVARL